MVKAFRVVMILKCFWWLKSHQNWAAPEQMAMTSRWSFSLDPDSVPDFGRASVGCVSPTWKLKRWDRGCARSPPLLGFTEPMNVSIPPFPSIVLWVLKGAAAQKNVISANSLDTKNYFYSNSCSHGKHAPILESKEWAPFQSQLYNLGDLKTTSVPFLNLWFFLWKVQVIIPVSQSCLVGQMRF